jgi:hypothetical protein
MEQVYSPNTSGSQQLDISRFQDGLVKPADELVEVLQGGHDELAGGAIRGDDTIRRDDNGQKCRQLHHVRG